MTAFLALLRRDLHVTLRNAPFLMTGTLNQPVLVVLVFGPDDLLGPRNRKRPFGAADEQDRASVATRRAPP